ncbi:MAG: RodZ domain-containing protein [Pyrinomonadaceae bacterium]
MVATTSSFGAQLRAAREARNITLREISEQTRISVRYLEAIETDDYKRLPGGIFNRSFIKTYARYIGYDEKEALEGYARTAREHGESPDEVTSTPYQPRVYTDDATRSPLVTGLLTVIILAVLSLGVYAGLHWYTRQRGGAPLGGGNNTPPPAKNIQTAAPNTVPNQPQSNASAPAATAPVAPTANFNIQIKARGEKVWIKAKPDDGEATETTLNADETREFKPAQQLRIQYARAKASVLEITVNGRPAKVPADAKGGLAELVITRQGYEQQLQ